MKKAIFLFVLLIAGASAFSQTEKKKSAVATFEGFDGAVYAFMDEQEAYLTFDQVEPAVMKQFPLETDEFLYELFKITYIEVKGAEDDILLKIVGLEVQSPEEDSEDY